MKLLLATEAGDSSPLEMPRDVDATRVSAILKSCDVEDLVGGPVRNGSAGGSAEASVDGSDDANANAEEGDLTPLIESWACKVVGASESMAQRAHELIATLKARALHPTRPGRAHPHRLIRARIGGPARAGVALVQPGALG